MRSRLQRGGSSLTGGRSMAGRAGAALGWQVAGGRRQMVGGVGKWAKKERPDRLLAQNVRREG